VVVVGCEPADVERVALQLSEPVKAAVDRAAAVVLEQLNKLQSDAAYEPS
jgi:Ni,Fe-hydrogenase maturation factor